MNDKRKRQINDDGELFEDDLVIFEEDYAEYQQTGKTKRRQADKQKRYAQPLTESHAETSAKMQNNYEEDTSPALSRPSRKRRKKSILRRIIEEIFDFFD